MSASKGFKQVFMAGVVGAAALSCYLVSLSVASTRAELESVEGKILLAQRDIRTLETEVGTRSRLAQLERWNTNFIRLSAPKADQFAEGSFQLATMMAPERKAPDALPVVMASAPVPARERPALTGDADETGHAPGIAPSDMMHTASLKVAPVRERAVAPALATTTTTTAAAKATVAVRPAAKKTDVKTASAVVSTKPKKSAVVDPLAPLSGASAKSKAAATKTKE